MKNLIGVCLAIVFGSSIFSSQMQAQDEYQQYPQQPNYPNYNQPYNPYGQQQDENFSAKSPFKLEIARLEASVYRPGEEPLPLSQVPRLNQGDVLKVKIANEAVNGIMPHQSKWDWTLLVAFINPSRNNGNSETLSQEIRLRDSGWYNDNFFNVPYDSQPMIFLYPKPKMRTKILELVEKRPDDIRQMGEKVIEISSAYAHISSFLTQVQFMMTNPNYNNGLLEQSIEGMARTFDIQMPSCWRSYSSYGGGYGYSSESYSGSSYGNYSGYNNLAARAQCLSRNVRVEDLNYSVGRMLQQGGLVALNQLRKAHPEISKWIALAAIAVDFFMKITRRTAIRIIPAVVSTPENPIFVQNGYSPRNYYTPNTNSYQATATRSNFAQANTGEANKISLLANYQPTDREFVTVYAYVPHKWQADPDPKLANLYAPQMITPCLHSGKNILRNTDLRVEWLSDTFTRDFKMTLTDNEGWKKEFPLRKNLGLNAWEVDLTKEDISSLPKTGVFEAKLTGKRGFMLIESPTFSVPIANGGTFEATVELASSGKNLVTVKRVLGDARCSQNIIYKPATGQPVIFPITKENSFLRISDDKSEIKFEVDVSNSQGKTDTIQVQLFGGELLNVKVNP